jgi:hypothetical protein
MFTFFTDRDGKYQLASLAESGFDPLARTCRFMLTEEAHHMFVGQTGVGRVVQRAAELMKAHPGRSPRDFGAIDLPTLQKYINFWSSSNNDLYGAEISSNSANFFGSSLKGRAWEMKKHTDHKVLEAVKDIEHFENGALRTQTVPMRNALNEVLREEFIEDNTKGIEYWKMQPQTACQSTTRVYTLAEVGRQYVTYTATQTTFSVVNFQAGNYRRLGYNPRTSPPASTTAAWSDEPCVNLTVNSFTPPPGSNGDWVLLLKKTAPCL